MTVIIYYYLCLLLQLCALNHVEMGGLAVHQILVHVEVDGLEVHAHNVRLLWPVFSLLQQANTPTSIVIFVCCIIIYYSNLHFAYTDEKQMFVFQPVYYDS